MTPTLLEFVMAIVLLVVAWQIGLELAPRIARALRAMKDDVDTAAEDAQTALKTAHTYTDHTEDQPRSNHDSQR